MKRILTLSVALLAAACQVSTSPPSARLNIGVQPAFVPSELVVRLKSGLTDAQKQQLRRSSGALHAVPVVGNFELWRVSGATDVKNLVQTLKTNASVDASQLNYRRQLPELDSGLSLQRKLQMVNDFSNGLAGGDLSASNSAEPSAGVLGDPSEASQWYLEASKFPEAWSTSTGAGVIVGVIDSGVDPAHPDLQGNLLPMIDEVAARGLSDQLDSVDFTGRDGNGHGTHVAGIIGAVANNGIGISGAAPGVKLLPVKVVINDGTADDVTIAKGIVDAVDHGAKVINLSLGGPQASLVLLEAINYAFSKHVSVVIAAGNDGGNVDYPAAFEGVISVGALNASNQLASYSNHGSTLVLVAPGGDPKGDNQLIYSTLPTYGCYESLVDGNSTSYGYMAGTSMAAPQVTAAVALLLSKTPGLAPAQVRTRLAATATDLGAPGFDPTFGYGALNAASAVADVESP